ncbi:MAG: alpha/beta fold hydrolase [Bacteroidota bacterium]
MIQAKHTLLYSLLSMGLLLAGLGCGDATTAKPETPAEDSKPTVPKVIEEGESIRQINDAKIFTKVIGKGEPILIVHGGPGFNHSYLLPHFQDLAKDHQLIFYDQQGCGRSGFNSDTAKISIAGMVEDIEALRLDLGIDQLNLLGHSWGGLLAMNYAHTHPTRIKRLLLVSPTSGSSQMKKRDEDLARQRDNDEDRKAMMAVRGTEAFVNKEPSAFEQLFTIGFRSQFFDPSLSDSLDMNFQDNFYKSSQVLYRFMGRDLKEYNIHQALTKVKAPCLLLYGKYESTALESRAMLKAAFDNSDYVEIEKAGHFPFIEQPTDFFAAIRQFMAK